MGKIVRITLWSLGILLGLLLLAGAGFYLNYRLGIKDMTPVPTAALNDSVFSIRDNFVNAFVFRGKEGYLMVDAGFSQKSVSAELKKLGIAPGQITSILLTHADSDHTGAIGLFNMPKIYLHKEEEQMINGQTAKVAPFKMHWEYGPYILLNSNDTLTIDGLNIKVIHTPGHTPGSVCYVVGSDYLVTGDNLIVDAGRAAPFLDKFNMDTPAQVSSLKGLPDLKSFKYILTGHYGVTKN
jgi:glyoxylase-like metal-dependent hydrolase (beta-lactamase superfamily II)